MRVHLIQRGRIWQAVSEILPMASVSHMSPGYIQGVPELSWSKLGSRYALVAAKMTQKH